MDLQKKVDALLKRYQEGNCTPQEEELVESVLFDQTENSTGDHFFHAFYKQSLWGKLEKLTVPAKSKRMVWYYYGAAAVVLLLGFSTYFMLRYNTQTDTLSTHTTSLAEDIPPGGNRATLTLADGRKIDLDNLKDGIVVHENGINYSDESSLGISQNIDQQKTEFLEVSIPRGGQYQVTLSDGTRVWLNSDSKLRYPNRFDEDIRQVYLEGEAYFEVNEQPLDAKDQSQDNTRKKPFIVKTRHQEVQVLGTKFNINSYEQAIKTTLASGRLRIQNESGTAINLAPNELSISTSTGIHKTSAIIEHEMAWRYGKFSFDNKSFATIMNELSRWYNIDVVYKNEVPKTELVGDAFRNQNISLILRLLDASNVNYKLDIDKRTLLIY